MMTADIDREKLRELCERATGGEWSYEPHGNTVALYSGRKDIIGDFDGIKMRGHGLRLMNLDDGDRNFENNAAFIVAARTALPVLLDLTDAQAAELAELEAENATLKSDEDFIAKYCVDLESERDQLRKQVEGQFVAGMKKAAEIAKNITGTASYGSEYYCAAASVQNHILSAASALEQKEQG